MGQKVPVIMNAHSTVALSEITAHPLTVYHHLSQLSVDIQLRIVHIHGAKNIKNLPS